MDVGGRAHQTAGEAGRKTWPANGRAPYFTRMPGFAPLCGSRM